MNKASAMLTARPAAKAQSKAHSKAHSRKEVAEMIKALVTVTGKDRTGIIAGVSGCLARCDVNILEISQSVLSGYFTMMMVVDLSGSSLNFAQINQALKADGEKLGMNITMQRMDIFDAMHRI